MKLPEKPEVLIITLSNRAYNSEYTDLSGSAVKEYMSEILLILEHTVYMQYGVDAHEKH